MKKERDSYPQHQKFQGYFFHFVLNESSFQDFLSERLKSERRRNETKRTKSTGK